ncbi:putative zinc finger protein gcs1 [Phaeomoniella chlamydospora]|uniref:Putative zinc finger protein gcs1 n=1 Tax=Phaeomoniella chlamydospora TaxID=158046 RepID=A0A0G2GGE7_PHACM|nr:putative zinc finger protein gcs1 [Phaeomoniella chlamydospora]
MDAFKTGELLRMQEGGNAAWQNFFNDNNPTGTTFEEATIKERYEGEVGEEWKERLTAKIEQREFDKEAWQKERVEAQKVAAAKKSGSTGVGSDSDSRSASPAISGAAGKKAQNEAYFARMGAENASRPDGLPPNQGGKYAGFGSAPPPTTDKPKAALPSADEFQQDPVAALTKGFGWFSSAVTKSAKAVNDQYIAPTAKTIGSSDLAAQARIAALNAEGDNYVASSRPSVGGGARAGAEPERKDFWDSFGQDASTKGSLGTGAMKGSGGGTASKAKPKGEDGWGEEW